MVKYVVKLLPKAHRDIDEIYGYISQKLLEKDIAKYVIVITIRYSKSNF